MQQNDQAQEATKTVTPTAFNETLSEAIDGRRRDWDEKLAELLPQIRNSPEQMVDVQATALSYRQTISEEIAYWGKQRAAIERKLKKQRKDRFLYYATGELPDGIQRPPHFRDSPMVNLKTTKGEKDLVIAGDLAEHEYTADLYGNMIDYLTECRKTVDNCLYGVRNRIELLKVLML